MKSQTAIQKVQINLNMLKINKLDQNFSTKCINDRNEDGTIAQRGRLVKKIQMSFISFILCINNYLYF